MLSIFFIGIALSMDAFSIALSIGTNNLSKKSIVLTITLVGLMHFIMPQLGLMLGNQVYNFINIIWLRHQQFNINKYKISNIKLILSCVKHINQGEYMANYIDKY